MGGRQTGTGATCNDITRCDGARIALVGIGRPGGKAQIERAIASCRQLVRRNRVRRTGQQVRLNATRHAAGKHQILGHRLTLRQILSLKRRRGIVALYQAHAMRVTSGRHAGKQLGQAIEILSIEHPRGRTTEAQIALSSPIGNVMGALMAVECVARHLIGVVARRTQTLARRVHARCLKILVGLERLVAARHAIEWRSFLECERIDRHVMRGSRKHAIERALPTRSRLTGKPAHKVARHVKPRVFDRRDGRERTVGIVDAADSGKLVIIERLHAK